MKVKPCVSSINNDGRQLSINLTIWQDDVFESGTMPALPNLEEENREAKIS